MTETIILPRHWRNAGLSSTHREDRDIERRPHWLDCTYEAFLAHLRQVHGEGYLLRPDGSPLEARRPSNPQARRFDPASGERYCADSTPLNRRATGLVLNQ